MDTTPLSALLLLVAAVAFGFGFVVSYLLASRRAKGRLVEANIEAARILETAQQDAERQREQYIEEAQTEVQAKLDALEEERQKSLRNARRARQKVERRHKRINDRTRRVNTRSDVLDAAHKALKSVQRKTVQAQRRAEKLRLKALGVLKEAGAQARELEAKVSAAKQHEEELASQAEELSAVIGHHQAKLEEISGLTIEEAKEALKTELLDEARLEASATIKSVRDEATLTAGREARRVVLTTIQRIASTQSVENTVSVVHITSDDVKGRIIGREGRNIKAFESATGIDVMVDDTPEAVTLSGFDPVRREIARIALERLIKDGRIHPARVERMVGRVAANMAEELVEIGERTVIDLQLHGLHPELIRLIGRMRYRSSYGQNLLAHSKETARIASIMAAEVGENPHVARRAGLLHDIGKVIIDEVDRPHAIVGMEYCKRYKETAEVCNAVGAHHDEIEMTHLVSPIVQASDAISGARPGARRDQLQAYIQRLHDLEELASSFKGVKTAYAIQGGREVRVMVNSGMIRDNAAQELALKISRRIESELHYPGQIKVIVIREVRSSAVAN